MVYVVRRVPVNAKLLYYQLFAGPTLPPRTKAFRRAPVLIDTTFPTAKEFGAFGRYLSSKRKLCLLVPTIPHSSQAMGWQ